MSKTLNSEEREILEQVSLEMEADLGKPAAFLSAWKCAVELIGDSFFSIASGTVEAAKDKWDLRPDMAVVEKALPALSSGERCFLIGVCQFYCDSDIKHICEDIEIEVPTLADYANLDNPRRSVLVDLMSSYTGW